MGNQNNADDKPKVSTINSKNCDNIKNNSSAKKTDGNSASDLDINSRIRTSDFKDYSQTKNSDDKKQIARINFAIIKEIFNILKNNKLRTIDFYIYIYSDKSEDRDIAKKAYDALYKTKETGKKANYALSQTDQKNMMI